MRFEELKIPAKSTAVWGVSPGFAGRSNVPTLAVRAWRFPDGVTYVDRAVQCWNHETPWPDILVGADDGAAVIVPQECNRTAIALNAAGFDVTIAGRQSDHDRRDITIKPTLAAFFADMRVRHVAQMAAQHSGEVIWI